MDSGEPPWIENLKHSLSFVEWTSSFGGLLETNGR